MSCHMIYNVPVFSMTGTYLLFIYAVFCAPCFSNDETSRFIDTMKLFVVPLSHEKTLVITQESPKAPKLTTPNKVPQPSETLERTQNVTVNTKKTQTESLSG